ncbi:hypothetical protein AArcSl_1514 [Halalkaliarchaeum desulfuricum]|uniref:Fe-S oxidoreductase n=1 Tax=Halalkaliarchaeum desulfuricum TaxID=2055893 RepID=A0A343TJ71_9EURY|nr:YkgJ family cysteine cluster protein [Halalkaliarchaeum desulfuricum]AUX09143.1 hypothetical protein AArcSl_1514 [Halalkaliarchaeum desulfuricum]
MNSLEADLERARELDAARIADAVESIGFECTRCGGCCTAEDTDVDREPHTATVFPDEVRRLQATGDREWGEIARPMPYGIDGVASGGDDAPNGATREPTGETFEWALAVDGCGDCVFYTKDEDGVGACTVHEARPLVCRTYPFSLDVLSDRGEEEAVVERDGSVLAHECAGLGRDISRADAEAMAETLKRRAIRELEEAIAVRDSYRPTAVDGVVVHDSEGQKRPDGTPLEGGSGSSGSR